MAFDYHRSALKIARAGARRLAKLVQGDGRFIYRYIPERNLVSNEYNVLRHCGAVWSMLEVTRMTGAEPAVHEAAVRAAGYMLEHFVKPIGDDGLCVVDGLKIKLGGNGLALLALYEFHRAAPDPKLVETARALGRYILSQRTDDGDFVHCRVYPSGELHPLRSDYYTGEALFGLLRLHQMTGEALWRDAALELVAALGPRDYGVAEQSHWMVYTLDLADQLSPDPATRRYASRIAAHIMAHRGYMARARSTPIACRSEALLAYMRILRRMPGEGLRPSLAECEQLLRLCLSAQVSFSRRDGSFVCGRNKPDVRIDYIQHNISAFAAFGLTGPARPETAMAEAAL
ncbi:MAG TPA: hypothetical protein VN240_01045 [Propylenella sp.]|nr:hypothetical protein [Propylenella sp.]